MNKWTPENITFLKLNHKKFTDKQLAIQLDKTIPAIRGKRKKLKLKKIKKLALGAIFGRLTVISECRIRQNRGRVYLCRCECGKEREYRGAVLKAGNAKSCGCYHRDRVRKAPGLSSWLYKYRACKGSAINREYKFELSLNEFKNISSMHCHWCNERPHNFSIYLNNDGSTRTKQPRTKEAVELSWIELNGIDRINNNLGYFAENCVACCKVCNIMKGILTVAEFILHVAKIMEHQKHE